LRARDEYAPQLARSRLHWPRGDVDGGPVPFDPVSRVACPRDNVPARRPQGGWRLPVRCHRPRPGSPRAGTGRGDLQPAKGPFLIIALFRGDNEEWPLFRPWLATARSGRPSPLKSAAATEKGASPAAQLTAGPNVTSVRHSPSSSASNRGRQRGAPGRRCARRARLEVRDRSQKENRMILLLSGAGLRCNETPPQPARRPSAGAVPDR